MSIRKADTDISESSTAKISNVIANNSESNVLKLMKLALDLVEKKINLEQDETFFQLFKGTDVVNEFERNNHLIHCAAFCNLAPLVKIIIKHYPQAVHSENKFGDLAIHYASSGDVIKLLVEAGCSIDTRNSDGFTALMKATLSKDEDLVLYLLKSDANPTLLIPNSNLPTKFLTDDKFIIKYIEKYESEWISKDNKNDDDDDNLSD